MDEQARMISFGLYLLSDKRKERIMNNPFMNDLQKEISLQEISDADYSNYWGLW